MKFITLSKSRSTLPDIAISANMIVALEPTPAGTLVYVIGHQSFTVDESIEEIQNKIKATEGFATINYDPKK